MTKHSIVLIKEACYDVLQDIHGLPTTAATTKASKLAGQQEALHSISHSYEKYLYKKKKKDNQAKNDWTKLIYTLG